MIDKAFFRNALVGGDWCDDVLVEMSPDGRFAKVEVDTEPGDARRFDGIVVPGMSNLHSHAFQRAMAGLAEVAGPGDDSFWTWRKVMYGFVGRLTPEDLEAIAGQLYVELLKAGYTRVGEFHYLHHQPDGEPYDNLAELSQRIAAAAGTTGIALTHLPVLYAHGGFGGANAQDGQRRFLNDAGRFLRLVEGIAGQGLVGSNDVIGVAPHSLRAVTHELLRDVLDGLSGRAASGPIHIHIAEQTKEVDDCIAWSGLRPVQWLFDHFEVDRRWCLVHATHMDDAEVGQLAASGAVAGLCPATEANLGDGLFPAVDFAALDGRFGIGSDSHISTSLTDELRTLEYGLRLTRRQRNVLNGGEGTSVGRWLFERALAGGAQACGVAAGIVAGVPADFVVLDDSHPALAGRSRDQALDAWIFFDGGNPVRDVVVSGRQVIEDGRHVAERKIAAAYARSATALIAAL
jgi:formimidoylglutamate deiminase